MSEKRLDQTELDNENRAFWDELCGSGLAASLGITQITEESLARFDDAYMRFYPYLSRYLDRLAFEGKEVLEVGLGYGTVGAIIARRAAQYVGVDIADGPVAMMNDRARWLGLGDRASARQASVLDLPLKSGTVDFVVSIGCLHHTGDLPRAVSEVHRVLRPGGTAFVMLYNRHSFRQLVQVPLELVKHLKAGRPEMFAERIRGKYDVNAAGEAAPHTEYVSRRDVAKLFHAFSAVRARAENFDAYTLRFRGRSVVLPRERMLGNVARILGLDLYIHASK